MAYQPNQEYTYQDKSGANFSARIAALRDNSSRIANSAVLRYWQRMQVSSKAIFQYKMEMIAVTQKEFIQNLREIQHDQYLQ